MHCLVVLNILEIQSRTRLPLSQSQQLKRLLNAIAYKHYMVYNRSLYIYIYNIYIYIYNIYKERIKLLYKLLLSYQDKKAY